MIHVHLTRLYVKDAVVCEDPKSGQSLRLTFKQQPLGMILCRLSRGGEIVSINIKLQDKISQAVFMTIHLRMFKDLYWIFTAAINWEIMDRNQDAQMSITSWQSSYFINPLFHLLILIIIMIRQRGNEKSGINYVLELSLSQRGQDSNTKWTWVLFYLQ